MKRYFHLFTKPRNDRDWHEDQATLSFAEIEPDKIHVHNIRNFIYKTPQDFIKQYYDKTYNINEIQRLWYVVVPFSGIPGSAHTFLSFEFADNQYLCVSIEIRKVKGDKFHPIKGMFNYFELMYVLADECDVIKLRTNYRDEKVYVYPVNVRLDVVKELFVSMMKRVNQLNKKPEYYNTLFNSCISNIIDHVHEITGHRVPWFSWEVIFPAHSDKMAYRLGIIDTKLTFEEARKRFYVNEKAKKVGDNPEFSKKIREE